MSIYNCNGSTADGRTWFFKVRYVNRDGVKMRKTSKKFFTRAEALKAQEEFILKIDTSGIDVPVSMNFSTLFKHFLNSRYDLVNFSTIKFYNTSFKKFAVFHKTKCVDFTAEQFEIWKKSIITNYSYSLRYKNDLVKFWKSLLNFGSAYYGFNFRSEYNKISKFVDPGAMSRQLNYYTYNEFRDLLKCENDLMYRCIWQLFYYCGLRPSELQAITWKKLDLRNKLLTINKIMLENPGGSDISYYISDTVNRAQARTIPMQKLLVRDLRRYYSAVSKNKNFKRIDFAFTRSNGLHPISRTTLYKRLGLICTESGIKKIKLQEFRHSCAYLLITNGANIVTVAGFFGLSEISDVYDNYSRFLPMGMHDMLNVINGLNDTKKL